MTSDISDGWEDIPIQSPRVKGSDSPCESSVSAPPPSPAVPLSAVDLKNSNESKLEIHLMSGMPYVRVRDRLSTIIQDNVKSSVPPGQFAHADQILSELSVLQASARRMAPDLRTELLETCKWLEGICKSVDLRRLDSKHAQRLELALLMQLQCFVTLRPGEGEGGTSLCQLQAWQIFEEQVSLGFKRLEDPVPQAYKYITRMIPLRVLHCAHAVGIRFISQPFVVQRFCSYRGCFEAFSEEDSLWQHQSMHEHDRTWDCGTCRKSFVTPESYYVHLRKQHGYKLDNLAELKDDICGYAG